MLLEGKMGFKSGWSDLGISDWAENTEHQRRMQIRGYKGFDMGTAARPHTSTPLKVGL